MSPWVELEPDFGPADLRSLSSALPFSLVAASALLPAKALIVVVAHTARLQFETHMIEHSVETGGLLLGRIIGCAPAAGTMCLVEDAVPSREFDGTGVSLVMGTSVWDDARALTHEGRGVVGWYHSHPNLGAFFSGTDRKTQRDFFNTGYALGLVRDPIRKEEKWFVGLDSEPLDPQFVTAADLTPMAATTRAKVINTNNAACAQEEGR